MKNQIVLAASLLIPAGLFAEKKNPDK